jgi:hypothetical protein
LAHAIAIKVEPPTNRIVAHGKSGEYKASGKPNIIVYARALDKTLSPTVNSAIPNAIRNSHVR